MGRGVRILVAVWLVLQSAWRSLPAQAQLPVLLPPGVPLVAQHFHSGNGLPQNSIGDLLQARSGHLWVATFGGLCRFDGSRWRTYDTSNTPGLPGNRVLRLLEDRDGELWLGLDGAGLVRWRNGKPLRMAGFHGKVVTSIAQLPDGPVVAASESDVFVVDEAGERVMPLYAAPQPGVLRLLSAHGRLYAAGHQGLLVLQQDAPQLLLPGLVRAMAALPQQQLLLARDRGLQVWSAAGVAGFGEVIADPVLALHATASGDVWYATSSKLVLRAHAEATASFELPLTHALRAIAVDAAGGVWAGSIGGGLQRLRTAELVAHGASSGLPRAGQNAVAPDGHGGLYVATYAGLFHGVHGQFTRLGDLPAGPCAALLPEADGSLWVGQEGVLLLRRPGQPLRSYALPDDGVLVHAIARVDGELWVGTGAGLAVLRGDRLESLPLHSLVQRGVTFLKVDNLRRLWIAGPDYCLRFGVDRQVVTSLQAGEQMPHGGIRGVLVRPDGDAWLANYGGGLALLPTHATRVTRSLDRRHGLHDHGICNVAELGSEVLVGSNRGLFWLDTRQLDRLAAGQVHAVACRPVAGPLDPTVEASGGFQPATAIVGNSLFLCGIGPLLEVRGSPAATAHPAPTCHLERVLAGGGEIGPGPGILVPPAARTLSLQLAACEFDCPDQVRFRWRLWPGNGIWSPADSARDIQLVLEQPGQYRFEAEALAPNGASGVPAVLELTIPQLWHEAIGTRVGLGAMVLLLAVLLYRFGATRTVRRELQLQRLVAERTAALRQAQDSLEQRVQQRTAALKLALERIDASHRERGRMERELELLRRMESLGQLAGGIAHDFNNLLTVVLGNAAMLELELGDQPQRQELAARIREAGERGRRMTRHLLSLASRQTVAPVALDLNQQVAGFRRMLEDLCGPRIALQLELAPGPMTVLAAPSQIEQILMNLAVNARDAMPEGGKLTIAVRAERTWVELSVADTGTGMTPAVRERAFEPFFTTKGRKLGTGLGLSTVFGITKQLQGEVTIDSAPGQGTVCRCRLPLADAGPALPALVLPQPTGLLPRQVLLVDDEAEVRRVLRSLLERAGCAVVEADCGEQALHCLDSVAAGCELVLSDVRMPGLVGAALVAALRARRPGLPMVFVTGHADDAQTLVSIRALGIEVLEKPPVAHEVLDALRRAMRAAVGANGVGEIPDANATSAGLPMTAW